MLLRRLAVVLHRVSAVGAAGGGGAVGCAAVDLGLDVGTVPVGGGISICGKEKEVA